MAAPSTTTLKANSCWIGSSLRIARQIRAGLAYTMTELHQSRIQRSETIVRLPAGGGGIASAGQLTISTSLISNNVGDNGGGGLITNCCTEIADVTFDGNS